MMTTFGEKMNSVKVMA